MDRIAHSSHVDIGGGRWGFRSKDTVAGIPGTVVTATHMNATQEEMLAIIEKAGLAPDPNDLAQLTKAIRSHHLNFFAAGGTANALTISLDPAPEAWADLNGVPLWIVPAASSTVAGPTLAVTGLAGAKVMTYADGVPLLKGDLANGRLILGVYLAAVDKILVLTVLQSIASREVAAQLFRAPAASNSIPSAVATKLTNFGAIKNTVSDLATWDAVNKRLVIGANGAGVYDISVTLDTNLPLGSSYGMSLSLVKNGGASICGLNLLSGSSAYLGPFGSASRTVELVATDYLEVFGAHNFGSNLSFQADFTAKYAGRA